MSWLQGSSNAEQLFSEESLAVLAGRRDDSLWRRCV
jgi:hypothetical protein